MALVLQTCLAGDGGPQSRFQVFPIDRRILAPCHVNFCEFARHCWIFRAALLVLQNCFGYGAEKQQKQQPNRRNNCSFAHFGLDFLNEYRDFDGLLKMVVNNKGTLKFKMKTNKTFKKTH